MSEDQPHGLAHDLPRLTRRAALGLIGSTLALPAAAQSCLTPFAVETEGPYPANGMGRGGGSPNVLAESGILREDIRSSFAGLTGTAPGVPLKIELTLQDTAQDCAPMAGAAVYVWHCDAAGGYSVYALPDQNYLRGVQIADPEGRLTFTTVYPGCYRGRVPHIHFQVFPTAEDAATASNSRLISQFAFPDEVSTEIYRRAEYDGSIAAFNDISLSSDNVFRDNTDAQIAAMTFDIAGSIDTGLTASATVGIA